MSGNPQTRVSGQPVPRNMVESSGSEPASGPSPLWSPRAPTTSPTSGRWPTARHRAAARDPPAGPPERRAPATDGTARAGQRRAPRLPRAPTARRAAGPPLTDVRRGTIGHRAIGHRAMGTAAWIAPPSAAAEVATQLLPSHVAGCIYIQPDVAREHPPVSPRTPPRPHHIGPQPVGRRMRTAGVTRPRGRRRPGCRRPAAGSRPGCRAPEPPRRGAAGRTPARESGHASRRRRSSRRPRRRPARRRP